ncbi:MAG TPA: DNA polymerase III subunit epsilon [Oceanospirillales bacterium]|jgi:DNA polymerase-3 subunit epsilon|nr:DNA polymerase III subunit epsilon [Oleispira sp.]HCM06330.1 DNA polymerase III subunit epsilon [Oceanospirillales bacterium]|tara:strand:+ start:1268 stop:1972 length:705 start_codon:yes stop_codon:yes gene_type:complete
MRQVVLDTETTGIGAEKGHRIIEIGCVELVDRKLTGRHYHQYVNPQRPSDEEAVAVHGITDEFLADKPFFEQVAQSFYDFIDGAELVIHNAPFDVGFMDMEFRRVGMPETTSFCSILDTLVLARDMHPGQRNSLDALCRRYGIDNSHRELHGALLDAEILSDVYLMMTGGQTDLMFMADNDEEEEVSPEEVLRRLGQADGSSLQIIRATADEIKAHDEILDMLDKKSDGAIWRR